jgi:hypothetical protein
MLIVVLMIVVIHSFGLPCVVQFDVVLAIVVAPKIALNSASVSAG